MVLGSGVKAAGGPVQAEGGPYRVLAPIESGNLLVVSRRPRRRGIHGRNPVHHPRRRPEERRSRSDRGRPRARAGAAPRAPSGAIRQLSDRGDQVNTLVLVNHSKRPLLLLAGEIVTGGKQDRIIAKDRIVPADADPIDLGSSASSRAAGLKARPPSAPPASPLVKQLHGAARSAREGDGRPGPAAGLELGARRNLADGSCRRRRPPAPALRKAKACYPAHARHHQLRQGHAGLAPSARRWTRPPLP